MVGYIGWPCPHCKVLLDISKAMPVGEDGVFQPELKGQLKPEPGDSIVCANCGNWLTFNSDGSAHPITEEEIINLSNELMTQMCLASKIAIEMKALRIIRAALEKDHTSGHHSHEDAIKALLKEQPWLKRHL